MPLMTHLEEDVLEAYSLGRIADDEAAALEEHLLICRSCQERLDWTDDFVRAFRMAVRSVPQAPKTEAPRSRFGALWSGAWFRPAPMAAGLALAAMAVITLAPRPPELAQAADVRLAALRGPGGLAGPVVVPAYRTLRLELDAKALPGASYRIELADARGRQVWQSSAPAAVELGNVRATVPRPIPAGLYWVRLYDPATGALAREYGLRAE